MQQTLDHRALVDSIIEEVAAIVADPTFAKEETSLVARLEQDRIALTDMLRTNAALVQKVKDVKAGRGQPETFAQVRAVGGVFEVKVAGFMGFASEEEKHPLGIRLMQRSQLYQDALLGEDVSTIFMTDGDEYVFPYWATDPLSPRQTFLTSTWTTPADTDGFPHHTVGYLHLAARLLAIWMEEPGMPGLKVSLGKKIHTHPLLPVKALMLDSVDRLPPVFFSLDKLRTHLNRITSVGFESR